METFKVENLSFSYPNKAVNTINSVSFGIKRGEFVLICGKSGCGKTTLLRLLKSSLSPFGKMSGTVLFDGKPLSEHDALTQASRIGFVMQSPDNQIVTDKVWHELSFGLESLGLGQNEIRTKVSEMASFFGIQNLFYQKTSTLSGGQKQLLNLASVMVMQPDVLILDEPTSQLDPIAAAEFLSTVFKINRELGTTVILTEHRLEDAFPLADRVLVMDSGRIISDTTPEKTGEILKKSGHCMQRALPTPMRVHAETNSSLPCPVTVRDGRMWLDEYAKDHVINPQLIPTDENKTENSIAVIEITDAWFRHEKNCPDIIKGLNLKIQKGELFCITGSNGAGKTTALSLIAGLNKPYRGEVKIKGKRIGEISNPYDGLLGVLPQNPQSLFVKSTVYLDLKAFLADKKPADNAKKRLKNENALTETNDEKIKTVSQLCNIENLMDSHPYDLSGGETERAALAKILLQNPEILILDEPTKGMDAHFKDEFADILKTLKNGGTTIVMVSHDIEFCAAHADRCALFFDGCITSSGTPREFFGGKSFYTTSANRMAREKIPNAVLAEDIVLACTGKLAKKETPRPNNGLFENKNYDPEAGNTCTQSADTNSLTSHHANKSQRNSTCGKKAGCACTQSADTNPLTSRHANESQNNLTQVKKAEPTVQHSAPTKIKGTLWSTLLTLLIIPFTIFCGIYFFDDRKYYFISLLVITEALASFYLKFESGKPKAREIIILSVLCGLAVAGRAAFFMLPQFKPVVAIVIISGICFGGEAGFLVGSVTGFVSNFFFGHGPWTPWQMFALGIIGFVSGIVYSKAAARSKRTTSGKKAKASLALFGFLTTLLIYGGIMNPSSIIMMQTKITWKMLAASYAAGFPLDMIHALSTAFFLWFLAEPMTEILERVKTKYGIIER